MPSGYGRIVVPVDFSAGATRALREARKLLQDGGEIVLVHVTHTMAPAIPWSAVNRRVVARLSRQVQAEAHTKLTEIAEGLSGIRVRTRIVEGIAHEKILSEARRMQADAIVMGAQGLTLSERLLVGSTTERVIRKATLPVVVVPRPGKSSR